MNVEGNRTDVHIDPDHGEMVINDDLSFGFNTIRTRNSSLTLQAGEGKDIILAPSGEGIVKVESGMDIDDVRPPHPPLLLPPHPTRPRALAGCGRRLTRGVRAARRC